MSVSVRAGVLLSLLALAGCGHHGFFGPKCKPREVGAVQLETIPKAQLPTLEREAVVSTKDEYKRLKVFFRGSDPLHNYQVFLGDNSQGHVDPVTACFILDFGWVYACGYMPCVGYDGVSAGADGSCVVVWVDEKKTTRVFFIDGNYGWVEVKRNTQTVQTQWTDPKQYVEVPDGGNASVQYLSAAPQNIRDMHDTAQTLGAAKLNCP